MRTLGLLRGFAALAVVVGHSSSWGIIALAYWAHRYDSGAVIPNWNWVGTPGYYALIGIQQLSMFAIPLFLFASGFFINYAARGNPTTLTWPVIRDWLKLLLWPYLTWVMLSVLIYALTVWLSPSGRLWDTESFIRQRLAEYGFAPMMIQVMLLSPFLVGLSLRRPTGLLLLTALLIAVNSAVYYTRYYGMSIVDVSPILGTWDTINAFSIVQFAFFFSLGLVVSQRGDAVRVRLASVRWLLLAAVAGLWTLSLLEVESLHDIDRKLISPDTASQVFPHVWKISTSLLATVIILTLYSWNWGRGPLRRFIERMGANSYGIFLMNFVVLELTVKVVYRVAPQLLPHQPLLQPLLVIVGAGLPLLITSAPFPARVRRYRRYVFGS